MPRALWLAVAVAIAVAGCSTSPEAPDSYAQFNQSMTARSARASSAFVSYGAPYHKWSIYLSTTEGCAGDTVVELEVNTLSSVTAMPTGAIPIRSTETTIQAVPSAYVRYMAAPVLSGTATIDSATAGFISGSFTAMLMLNGTPTEVTATFGAPTCGGS